MEPEEFIEEIVKKLMYDDIEEAIKGKANFLAALGLMAYTEFMGKLITGDTGSSSYNKPNFEEFIELFPEEYKEHRYYLWNMRNNLVHDYIVKKVRINNNPDDPKGEHDYELSCALFNNEGEFNVNQYFKDFKKAVEKYLEKVHSDTKICGKFYKIFPKSTPVPTSISGEVVQKTFYVG